MMVKKFCLWDTRPQPEEWKDYCNFLMENYKEKDLDIEELLLCQKEVEFERLRSVMDKRLEHKILVIAYIQTKQSRVAKCSFVYSGNLKDIFFAKPYNESVWYCDGYNICCDEFHNLGVNKYIFREVRNNDNIQKLCRKIHTGKKVSASSLSYYTRSIALDVAKAIGVL